MEPLTPAAGGPAPTGKPPTRSVGGATIFCTVLAVVAVFVVIALLTSL